MSHLAEASTPQRGSHVPVAATGRFRVYLGMAPGVGKTYAMLGEAARGCDVVAGIVETHDRPATTAGLDGLEVVPPKTVTYRGARFTEMDLDAILARRPELVLVDELAHSNVPGSGRHEKRWQAGIDVHIIARATIPAADGPHVGRPSPEGSVAPTTGSDLGKPAATIWWQDGWWRKCR